MITATEKQWIKQKVKQYENRLSHLYVDTVGRVTIGEGNLIKHLSSAKSLHFLKKDTQTPASAQEIEEDYNKVLAKYAVEKLRIKGQLDISGKQKRVNFAASAYESVTKLKISDELIDELTTEHLNNFDRELSRLYGPVKFSNFPSNVKYALYDMVFNLGITKLKNLFPSFNTAINANNWAEAARQSHRLGIGERRNVYVHDLLKKAARSAKAKKSSSAS